MYVLAEERIWDSGMFMLNYNNFLGIKMSFRDKGQNSAPLSKNSESPTGRKSYTIRIRKEPEEPWILFWR